MSERRHLDKRCSPASLVDIVLGSLAGALVLGLGFSFTLLVKATSWRVILPVEFALLGLVVLAAALSARRSTRKNRPR
jgi:hypothetical protein